MRFAAPLALTLGIAVCSAPAIGASLRGDAAAGRVAFAQCAGCHSLVRGQNGIGPSLAAVVGRRVASVPSYAYSKALKAKLTEKWSPALLDAFLANPNGVIPGNKMGVGVANPKTRAEIIAYLISNSKD